MIVNRLSRDISIATFCFMFSFNIPEPFHDLTNFRCQGYTSNSCAHSRFVDKVVRCMKRKSEGVFSMLGSCFFL
jgi:hypothetical protein